MGKYDNLTDKEKDLIQRMVEGSEEVTSWVLLSHRNEGTLLSEEIKIDEVPSSNAFYKGLESRGYLTLGQKEDHLEVYLQQPAIEYGEYVVKNRLSQWWEDRMYELVQETSAWAKLFWIIFGWVLGILSTMLLKPLGWN
jgi:hypothetical protein